MKHGWLALLVVACLAAVPLRAAESARKGVDGAVLLLVPAGPFWMGAAEGSDHPVAETPRHEATTTAFYCARDLVTERQFATFVSATGYRPEGSWKAEDVVGQEEHPVTGVTWEDAEKYCDHVRGRLLTEAEWEKAARGTDEREYPWGNDWDATMCDNSADGASRGTMNVGTFPDSASPYGVLDMAGNVWEWTADWFHAYPGAHLEDDTIDRYRTVRGGSWLTRDPHSFRTTYRTGRAPSMSTEDIGFRYAVDIDQ